MKKSLLVAPALGVLLLAAAGSVGGTVAWFSSVSSVKASVGTFQSTALNGNLSIAMKRAAEKKDGENKPVAAFGIDDNVSDSTNVAENQVKVKTNALMTHASFDHINSTLATLGGDGNVTQVTDDDWFARTIKIDETNHDVFYAVKWTVEFQYDFAYETYVNLYLDPTSSITMTDLGEDGDGTTYPGFRIAFVPTTGDDITSHAETVIWAAERKEGETYDSNKTFHFTYAKPDTVSGSAVTAYDANAKTGVAYDPSDYILSTKEDAGRYTAATEGLTHYYKDSTGALKNGVIGQFYNDKTEGKAGNKISFTCVAWFEGTDPSIENYEGLAHSVVTASMKFYTREASAVYTTNEPAQNG